MEDLSVAEAAEVLGTSPQTVRTLLRKGELRGHKRAWGAREVWVVDEDSVVAFLDEFGRLDGARRRPGAHPTPPVQTSAPPTAEPSAEPEAPHDLGWEDLSEPVEGELPGRARPLLLRPRVRAAAVLLVLGTPVLAAYVSARVMPTSLWYAELGQQDMFRSLVTQRLAIHLVVLAVASVFLGANLAASFVGSSTPRSTGRSVATSVVTVVVANLFAARAEDHWQLVALWRHRRPFGLADPVHGQDVAFFVFTLPLLLEVVQLVLSLVVVTTLLSVVVRVATGSVTLRPLRARTAARGHLGLLAGLFLLATSWRLHLETYLLELSQPTPGGRTFAGANYVDLAVRDPVIEVLVVLTAALGVLLLLTPVVRIRVRPRARPWLGAVAGVVVAITALATTVLPAVVQRYVVDPNPLLSEQQHLADSITATRAALGLSGIQTEAYEPDPSPDAADYAATRRRLDRVATWDNYILGARMRELVADPPYFRPDEPALDVRTVDGEPQLTVVGARELDPSSEDDSTGSWENDRLAYTHGLGLVRMSASAVDERRQPRVLDAGSGVKEPRLYFGNLAGVEQPTEDEGPGHGGGAGALALLTPVLDPRIADPGWVLADTRRPEVDFPPTSPRAEGPYHYEGSGGIALSDWKRKLVFALALGSKELLLSDDLTPASRLLMHRDVHERLEVLAPFLTWEESASPVQSGGRVVYLAHGMTTSGSFPYAEAVPLGDGSVNYVRGSVVATVDAFDGTVSMYVADPEDPLIRAWQDVFPSLLRPLSELPDPLHRQLRYPTALFEAQATAYERFHDTDASVFASESDVWSRPLALSGPIDVAGDVDFDEDDEDDLRLRLETGTVYTVPAGEQSPRLVRQTYFSPARGQNLVASLSGWIGEDGRPRLGSRLLTRDPVNLGPAQVSRLVFAQPRVRNLLGLRNLEIRDLTASSLSSVLLGRPRILLTPQGVLQLQSLYEGSRGAGAARLLGVTAYLNGNAGLGPDIQSALRQALNQPPLVQVLTPPAPVLVGRPVEVGFSVQNARRVTVRVTPSQGPPFVDRIRATDGEDSTTWYPRAPGRARITVVVDGLDGTRSRASGQVDVLGPPPTLRVVSAPGEAVVGEPYRLAFDLGHASSARARVSTDEGVVLDRRYDRTAGTRELIWTPTATGEAVVTLRAYGTDSRATSRRIRLEVVATDAVSPPTVTFAVMPTRFVVGRPARFTVAASDCTTGTVRARAPDGTTSTWNFACPASEAVITWIPTAPGKHLLTASARGRDATVRTQLEVTVLQRRSASVDGGTP
ncbi:hypothetical protein GCM10009623_09850 [Nocardioides aestuarii]|uniref:UPF0182 family protein n=1 Tax=Nocardioides aestuarii TaxID=252231 RepID=A0ABW4TID4_9ACTN